MDKANEYHKLSHEEIREILRGLRVDLEKVLPLRFFHFIVKNPDYDPDNFSQEIEDSEEEIDTMEEIKKQASKVGFDWVWNNTIGNIPKNSEKWADNHSKKCPYKFLPWKIVSRASVHYVITTTSSGGTIKESIRDYDNDITMNAILEIEKEFGDIYAIF